MVAVEGPVDALFTDDAHACPCPSFRIVALPDTVDEHCDAAMAAAVEHSPSRYVRHAAVADSRLGPVSHEGHDKRQY